MKAHPATSVAWQRFLDGDSAERVFSAPTGHPSQPTGYCPCDRSACGRAWFYLKATLLLFILKLPFNRPKVALLRNLGARIGNRVFISADVWIDPAFPQLLTIEDDVMIGVGARIALHEFGRRHFQAGKVIIRSGAVVGGFAWIRHGVEIGADAVVAGGAVVGRDVPSGMLAVGNPARLLRPKASPSEAPINPSPNDPPVL